MFVTFLTLRATNFLLHFLADVADSAGVTLAHIAAREGHMTCLQTLVDHNIDVTIDDKEGRSPADYAYTAGQTGCGRYLVMEEWCWLLSQRVAKLHRELKDCKQENKDLKERLQASYLELSYRPMHFLGGTRAQLSETYGDN